MDKAPTEGHDCERDLGTLADGVWPIQPYGGNPGSSERVRQKVLQIEQAPKSFMYITNRKDVCAPDHDLEQREGLNWAISHANATC